MKYWCKEVDQRTVIFFEKDDKHGYFAGYPQGVIQGRFESDTRSLVKIHKSVPKKHETEHETWTLYDNPQAVNIVTECIRTEYLDPAIDYLIEKGMPDWCVELLRSIS